MIIVSGAVAPEGEDRRSVARDVWKAQDLNFDELTVAVKLLKLDETPDEHSRDALRRRFRIEANAVVHIPTISYGVRYSCRPTRS